MVRLRQVHGATVVLADPDVVEAEGDALVTDRSDVVLLVRMADCVPVLLADAERRVVGAVHAGRRGVQAGVVSAAVAAMRERGAQHIRAWIGPHVCGACYEVPAAMRAEVAAVVPAAHATTSWGTPSLDLGAGVAAQLTEAGVEAEHVGACTMENASLHSYRRDGAESGRMGALIKVAP